MDYKRESKNLLYLQKRLELLSKSEFISYSDSGIDQFSELAREAVKHIGLTSEVPKLVDVELHSFSPVKYLHLTTATGIERYIKLPTPEDQTAEALLTFYFQSLSEARAESFSARTEKSVWSLREEIGKKLKEFPVAKAVKLKIIHSNAYERHLFKSLPFEKNLIERLIHSRIISTSQLIEYDSYSLRLGLSLSPYILGFILEPLTSVSDKAYYFFYENELLILAKDLEDLERAVESLKAYFYSIGLGFEATQPVMKADTGVTFLSTLYKREKEGISIYPCDFSIDGLLTTLYDILNRPCGRNEAKVEEINSILKIFNLYFCFENSEIDQYVRELLIEYLYGKGKKSYRDIYEKCLCYHDDGNYHFKIDSCEVYILKSIDIDWSQKLYSGRYEKICPLCERKIVSGMRVSKADDQYYHHACLTGIYESIRRIENSNRFFKHDKEALRKRIEDRYDTVNTFLPLNANWRYYPLKDYLRESKKKRLRLDFNQIEEIISFSLPERARSDTSFWKEKAGRRSIADAWKSEGYKLEFLDMKNERLYLLREKDRSNGFKIPEKLTGEIPVSVRIQADDFFSYIIEKYRLKNNC